MKFVQKRLEELRTILRAENMSYDELHELQDLGARGLIDPGYQCAERVRLTFEQCNDAWIVRGMQRAGSGVDVDHGIGRMFTGTGAEIECSHGGRE